jgi:hypothetical protein
MGPSCVKSEIECRALVKLVTLSARLRLPNSGSLLPRNPLVDFGEIPSNETPRYRKSPREFSALFHVKNSALTQRYFFQKLLPIDYHPAQWH